VLISCAVTVNEYTPGFTTVMREFESIEMLLDKYAVGYVSSYAVLVTAAVWSTVLKNNP
jgi:hypothetical protein